ncbi:MAG: response regulator transcription factor [Deltaproteobacteria bacterium]|nr:response regulator transcription factor [Deltaproteobacteria bacterium]
MKVLIVEDDRKLLSFLARAFAEEGYVVDVCRTGAEALRQATSIKYELIVLDWMLPEQDGLSVCRELRRIGSSVPVLMLTARSEVGEKVTALDGGADDYVTKPFHLDELMARSRALTRRSNGANDGVIRAGPVVLDQRERKVHVNGVRLDITAREFALLALLARSAGRVVTRSEILSHVWDMRSDPGSNVIDVHVRNIRDKLGEAATWLETVRGQGYRFALAEPPP